jgi:hypothetical protein
VVLVTARRDHPPVTIQPKGQTVSNTLLTRLGAACGALYVVLVIVANDVLGSDSPDSNASAHAIGAWWRAHEVTNADWVFGFVDLFGLLCFPIFVIVLAWVLQRADQGRTWLPWAVLAMGLLSAAVKIASDAPMFALLWRADNGISDGLAAAMVDMNGAAFVLTWAFDAVMLAAAGGVILATRCLPRWLGWWALVTAPLLLATVPFAVSGPPTFLLALIWIIATSITIAFRGDRAPAQASIGIEATA